MASPIESLFENIFGSVPKKSGSAYEILSAIAMQLLEEGGVTHDARLRGQFSNSLYQIDVHHKSLDGEREIMGEAKDYSEQGKKVGRGDLQKLGGALPDLIEIDEGAFFSATGYTKPARQYAEASEKITGGKKINLYELAISTEEDEKGFIKTIVINMHIIVPNPELGEFKPAFTQKGEAILKKALLTDGKASVEINHGLSDFFNQDGTFKASLGEVTSKGYGEVNEETNRAEACYWLPEHYISIYGQLVPIHGLEYGVPHSEIHREIIISDDSEHRLVIRDHDGNPLRILTDKKLQEFAFDDHGNVIKR